jgi:hypothetical protein
VSLATTDPGDRLEPELYCPECGYDLRGRAGEICPECGLHFDPSTLSQSRIPWTHRRRIGNARAFLRTVWQATWRGGDLLKELSRPVTHEEAQRFRWLSAVISALHIMVVLLTGILLAGSQAVLPRLNLGWTGAAAPPRGAFDLFLPWVAGILLPPVLPIAWLLFIAMLSGVQSYWFHPRSIPVVRQNRAVTISYYAVSPLIWLPLPVLLFLGAIALELAVGGQANRAMTTGEVRLYVAMLIAAILLLPLPAMAWFNLVRLVHRATESDMLRTLVAAIGIPLAWLGCALLGLFAFPWVVGYLFLVLDSFR